MSQDDIQVKNFLIQTMRIRPMFWDKSREDFNDFKTMVVSKQEWLVVLDEERNSIREAFKTNPSVLARCQVDDVEALRLLWKRIFDHHNSIWNIIKKKKHGELPDDGTLQEQWPFWNAMEFVRTSPGSDGPRKIVKCDLCPYVCSSGSSLRHRRNMLRYHMKGVHGPKNLVCDYCGAKYSKFQPNAFKDHVNAVHLKLKPYKCKVEGCDYACGFNSSLNIHKMKHELVKKLICDHCGGSFPTKYKLRDHVNAVHLKQKNFKCDHCDWRTGYTTNLSLHLKKVHGVVNNLGRGRRRKKKDNVSENTTKSDNNTETSLSTQESLQNCDNFEPEPKTSDISSLPKDRADIRDVEDEELVHVCDTCEKKYSDKYHLQAHVTSVHLKIMRYKCDECDYAAAYSTVLKSHQEASHGTHGTETKVCELCSYTTDSDHHLKKHLKAKHGSDSEKVRCNTKASYEGEWQRFKSFWQASKSIMDDEKDCPGEDDFICYFDHFYHEKKYKKGSMWGKFERLNGYFKMERGENLRDMYPRLMHNFNSYAPDKVEKAKPHLCDLCDTVCQSQGGLNAHVATKHLKMKTHKCDECDYAATQPKHVRSHKRAKHSAKRKNHSCDQCDFATSRLIDLKKHKREAHDDLKHSSKACQHCPFTTKSRNIVTANKELIEHMNEAHPEEERAMESSTKNAYEKAWECFKRYCDGIPDSLTKTGAEKGRRLKCGKCDFATDFPERLAEHAQKPHDKLCDKCDYATPSQDMLDWHTEGGTRAKSETRYEFKCKQCEFAASFANSLVEHMRVEGHTQDPAVQCPKCKNEFFMSGILSHCEKCISKWKKCPRYINSTTKCPFKVNSKTLSDDSGSCDQCDFATSRWRELKKHKEVAHGDLKHKGKGEDDFLGYLEYLFYGRRLKVSSVLSIFTRLNHTFQIENDGKRLEDAHPQLVSFLDKIKSDVDNHYSCDHCAYTTPSSSRLKKHIRSQHEKDHAILPKTKVLYNTAWTTFEKFCDSMGRFGFPGEDEFICYFDHLINEKNYKMASAASIFSRLNNALQIDHGVKMQDAYPRLMERLRDGAWMNKSLLDDPKEEANNLEEEVEEIPPGMEQESTEKVCENGNDHSANSVDKSRNPHDGEDEGDPVSMYLGEMTKFSPDWQEKGRFCGTKRSMEEGVDEADFSPSKRGRPLKGTPEKRDEDEIGPEVNVPNVNTPNGSKVDDFVDEMTHSNSSESDDMSEKEEEEEEEEEDNRVHSVEASASTTETSHTGADDPAVYIDGSKQEVDPVTMYLREMEKYRHTPDISEEASTSTAKRKLTEGLDELDFSPSKKQWVLKDLGKEREGKVVEVKLMKQQCNDSDDVGLADEKKESCNDPPEEIACHKISDANNSKEGEDVQSSEASLLKDIFHTYSVDRNSGIDSGDRGLPDESDPVSAYLSEMENHNQKVEEKKGGSVEVARNNISLLDVFKLSKEQGKDKKERGRYKNKTFACKQCDFASKEEHIFAQHEQRPHNKCCDQCKYAAPSQNLLEWHIKNSHALNETKPETKEESLLDGMANMPSSVKTQDTSRQQNSTAKQESCKVCNWTGTSLLIHLNRTKSPCKESYDMDALKREGKRLSKGTSTKHPQPSDPHWSEVFTKVPFREVDTVKCEACGNSFKGAMGLTAHLAQPHRPACRQKMQEKLGSKDVFPLQSKHKQPYYQRTKRWNQFQKFCEKKFGSKEPAEEEFVAYFKEMFDEGKVMTTIWCTFSSLNSEYQEKFGERLQVAFPNLMLTLRDFQKNARLSCELCKFTTQSPDALARHEQRPHDKCCGLCEYSAPSQDVLDRHVRASHTKKLFCDQCLFATTDRHQGPNSVEKH